MIQHCALQLTYKRYAHMHGKYTKLFLKPTLCKTSIERGSSWYAVGYHPVVRIHNLHDGPFVVNTVNTVCGFEPCRIPKGCIVMHVLRTH